MNRDNPRVSIKATLSNTSYILLEWMILSPRQEILPEYRNHNVYCLAIICNMITTYTGYISRL